MNTRVFVRILVVWGFGLSMSPVVWASGLEHEEPESEQQSEAPGAESTTETEEVHDAREGVEQPEPRPSILLADTLVIPEVRVGWVVDGEQQWHDGPREYGPPVGGEKIATNLKCYVALGGTRIETGAGHPKGIVIRLGLTKIENAKPLFADIDPGTDITMIISGIRLNQPIKSHEGTGLMHMKYSLGDLEACSLPGTARNQYLMADPDDTLGGRVSQGVNATPGGLDGNAGHGEIKVVVDENARDVQMMVRHLQDPWESVLPGTFFEPIHLHAEAELITVDAEPFDREPVEPIFDPLDPRD
jgi:hypothetical protein